MSHPETPSPSNPLPDDGDAAHATDGGHDRTPDPAPAADAIEAAPMPPSRPSVDYVARLQLFASEGQGARIVEAPSNEPTDAPARPAEALRPAPEALPANAAAGDEGERASEGPPASVPPRDSNQEAFEALQNAPDPLVGRLIADKYRIEELLGGGAMGSVYLATQVALDRKVAVKVMHPSLASKSDFAARFHREAKASSRLSHPNIVAVTDFGEESSGMLYLVMELVRGRTLDHVIHNEWPLAPERTASIVSQVLSAMAVAHEAGIVHRDLKPENILVSDGVDDEGEPTDVVKVCDFGIAAILGVGEVASRLDTARHKKPFKKDSKRITIAGTVLGTPAYMSPEQGAGLPADARSDLYALGTVLYEMLTQCVPFNGSGAAAVLAAHVLEEPVHPCEVVRSACPSLAAVALRALEKLPDDRFQTARSMRTAIRRSISHPGAPIEDFTPSHGIKAVASPLSRPRLPSEPSASISWNRSTETLAAPPDDASTVPPPDDADVPENNAGLPRRLRLRNMDYGLGAMALVAVVLAAFFLWRRNDALASATAPPSSAAAIDKVAVVPLGAEPPPSSVAPAANVEPDAGPRIDSAAAPKLVAAKVAPRAPGAFHPDHARLYPKVFATSKASRASVTDMVSRAELTSCYQDALRRTGQSIGGRATAHLEIDPKGLVTSASVSLPPQLAVARACIVHRLTGQRIAVAPDAPHANADVLLELEP